MLCVSGYVLFLPGTGKGIPGGILQYSEDRNRRDGTADTEKGSGTFEDILSQTISQQLTDRIAESRKWAKDMSKLMQEIDTSMGLRFSLEWKPCKADNEKELDTADLEQILLRDRELLTLDDIEK